MYLRTWFMRVYARLQALADSGRGAQVVLGWGLLQGCIFPGLADLFFLPLALTRPERAYRLALLATLGTFIGSVLLYFLGAQALEWLQGPVANWFGLSPESFAEARTQLARYGAWAIFASTMSPLSTKWTSIASGAVGVPFAQFALALLAGRLLRTMVFAWLVRNGGADFVSQWAARAGISPRA
ncbi:MAG: VTT domain-containing protein [Gemmatimonadaceae bacterium]|nr:VTT domain-containing protein [Gemmatimonadaceae bacterium]